MSKRKLYLSPPHLGDLEFEYVRQAFESNWISSVGPNLTAFEKEFCEWTGAKHAVALASGTAALHLALLVAGVQPGDEVLCSTFTFAATANAIVYVGARPVFIDSDLASWNLDPLLCVSEIERLVEAGRPPGAVVPVHLYGQCVDLAPILEVCARHEVPVIEDAAEALGAWYGEKQCGTWGKAGIFSFNGNKIITTSGGGMLVSDDEAFVARARFLSTQAKEPTPDNHYHHHEVGFNYRMSNVLAGIGRGQLAVLSDRIERRRTIFESYRTALEDLPGLRMMPEPRFGRANRWLSCIMVDPGAAPTDRITIQRALEDELIESRPLWKPMHQQPAYSSFRVVSTGVSDHLFDQGLCLPSGTAMTDADIERVCSIVRDAFG